MSIFYHLILHSLLILHNLTFYSSYKYGIMINVKKFHKLIYLIQIYLKIKIKFNISQLMDVKDQFMLIFSIKE